jgi:hypothetical protein
MELIKEAHKYRDSNEASENLKSFLEKIEEIKDWAMKKQPTSTYQDFLQTYERTYHYN